MNSNGWFRKWRQFKCGCLLILKEILATPLGKTSQDCFCSEGSIDHPEQLTAVRGCGWFTRNGTWSRLIVQVFPWCECSNRSSSLSLIECLCCVRRDSWLQRAPTETRWCCCASIGFVLEGIGDSFGRLCCRCSHRLIDNFLMWSLYRVNALSRFCCEARMFPQFPPSI